MKYHKLIFVLALLMPASSFCQTLTDIYIYYEDFQNGMPSDYTLTDVDGNTPATPVSFVDEAWIISGDASDPTDLIAISTSWYTPAAKADDWLITPAITLTTNNTLSWNARANDPSFPDGYEVRISTDSTLTTDFIANAVLYSIAAESDSWQARSVDLSGAGYQNQTVYIAFRNTSTDMFLLSIDDIKVSCSPTNGLDANFDITDVSCPAGTDGIASVSAFGSSAPYSYYWLDSGQTSATVTGLAGGSYSVIVSDSLGCNAVFDFVDVNIPPDIEIYLDKIDATCGNSDGTALASAYGGTKPFSYKWNTGASDSNISSIAFGMFIVSVTDANNCLMIDSIELPPLSVITSSIDISCNGAGDGWVTATASGIGPFKYRWSTGDTIQSVDSLQNGSYIVTAIDVQNCEAVDTITVLEPDQLTMAIDKKSGCADDDNGTIIVNPAGGTAPYTYDWNTGATSQGIYRIDSDVRDQYTVVDTSISDTSIVTDLSSLDSNMIVIDTTAYVDSFSVVVTDLNGCWIEDTMVYLAPATASISVSTSVADVDCYGGNDGSVSVNVSGGTEPYYYSWNNNSSTSAISNLTSGDYYVEIIDANGCKHGAFESIDQPDSLILTVTSTNVNFPDTAVGTASAVVSGGASNYTYKWSNGDNTANVSGLSPGSYEVVVTDANGCTISDSVTISIDNVGINESDLMGSKIKIYPNPGKGVFNLNLNIALNEIAKISVVDLLGKQVFNVSEKELRNTTHILDLSDQPEGVYFLQIQTMDDVATKKLIITE